MAANKRRRHTPDQIIRKLAEGNKLLGTGQEISEAEFALQWTTTH
jgi:putative transposase